GTGNVNVDIVYNTIRINGITGYNCRTITGGTTGTRILNNILVSVGTPSIISSAADTIDFNIFYSDGSVDWTQTIPNLGPNNFSVDPQVLSSLDLHVSPSLYSNSATPLAGVTIDIDGDTRDPLNPDIGADEVPPLNVDLAASSILTPYTDSLYCGTVDSVKAVITNIGTDLLTNANVTLLINGSQINTLNWTGALALLESDTITLGTFPY